MTHKTSADGNSALQFQIGHIYFYGYAGLNPELVEAHLPVRPGETVDIDSFDRERNLIRRTVVAETGRPPSDVAAVCCDQGRHLLIYIGLRGASSRKLPLRKAPAGNSSLKGDGLQLYKAYLAAFAKAVESGAGGEDRSRGFALMNDPTTRKIQLEMRAYAVDHGPELESVLRKSADHQQREASACLLGYAQRSRSQIRSLISASTDPDAGVRNDAVRALGVLFSAKGETPADLDIRPLISMLWSGQWTDRNKASFALAEISRDRNAAILRQLRKMAMPPLVEGARWDQSHSDFFLLVLGRIAGIPDSQLQMQINAGKSTSIIAAAEESK